MITIAKEDQVREPTGRWRGTFADVWASREGKAGLAIAAVFLFIVVFGPLVAPYNPLEIGIGTPDSGPSLHHLLGLDGVGRDVLSRLLSGARSVIALPLVATALAFLIGGGVGMSSAYRGGLIDAVAARIIDVLLSMPPLLIVLVVITPFGGSAPIVVISVALVYSPRVARIFRGATQGVVRREYVQAAQARGEPTLSIIFREVFPNILPTALVEFAVRLSYVIIFIVTLNFLGLGEHPPSPNWGVMVAEARQTIVVNPVATLAPALAIGALSVGIGLLADAFTGALGLQVQSEFLR
jgi:peptide/nickel transport system permease protein